MSKYIFCFILAAALLFISVFPTLSTDFKVIKNPKPNIIETEKQYVQLEKIKTIDANLENGINIFKPFSISLSNDPDNVYIYDKLQAKIFIMDPELNMVKGTFGGEGFGPGELGDKGKYGLIFIQMGRNGKLYAYSLLMRKIIVYDLNGKFIKDINNVEKGFWEPLVDVSGNIYDLTVEDRVIKAHNQENVSLFTLTQMEDNFDFLFSTPDPRRVRKSSMQPERWFFTALTVKSRFLLYFSSSSTMAIIENNKISKQFRLWPKDVIQWHLVKLAAAKKRMESEKQYYDIFIPLFSSLFVDESDDRTFFLQTRRYDDSMTQCLYQFNDNGQLVKVLYVKPGNIPGEEPPIIDFKAKKNNRFYAVAEDKLILYRDPSEN